MDKIMGLSRRKRFLELDGTMVSPSKRVHQGFDIAVAAGATSATEMPMALKADIPIFPTDESMVELNTTKEHLSPPTALVTQDTGLGSRASYVNRGDLDILHAEMESRLNEERLSRQGKESELEARQANTDALLQSYIHRYDKLLVQLQDAHALNAGVMLDNKLLRREMAELEKGKDLMKAALSGLGLKYKKAHDNVWNLHHKLEETGKMLAQAQATIDGLPGASTYGNTDTTATNTASPATTNQVAPVNIQHEIYKFDVKAGRFHLVTAESVPLVEYSSFSLLADRAKMVLYPNGDNDTRAACKAVTLVEQLPRRIAGQVRLEKPTRRGYPIWLERAQAAHARYGTVGIVCTYVFETKDKRAAMPDIDSQIDR